MPVADRPNTQTPSSQRKIYLAIPVGEADDILADLPGGQSVSEATRRLHQQLHDARRRESSRPRMKPPATAHGDDVLYAPAQLVRQAPEQSPVIGWIVRKQDVTGISGVGVIGIYFIAPDGFTVYRWFGGPPQDQPKFEVYDNRGEHPFLQISGHNGNTELVQVYPPLEA